MKERHDLEALFQYACQYEFKAFNQLIGELEGGPAAGELWEAYLMRAQIKLYAADGTIWDDLERIAEVDGSPNFPSLCHIWLADVPNRFVVFSKAPGALRGFLQKLPLVRQAMSRWYGERGDIAVRQVQSEICYYLGEIRAALDLAEEPLQPGSGNNTDLILALGLRFRCHLALGQARQAEECMLDMIKLAQSHPECQAVYQVFRDWANLTTNWNGDSPRFYTDASGRIKPVFDDRVEMIRLGGARANPLEEMFVNYAKLGDRQAYSLRQYYMDFFHSMYWFEAGDQPQTESYFCKFYQIAIDSGICMPLVECGEQITPLLRHAKDSGWNCCSPYWLDRVISMAEDYEKSLTAYKDSDT